MLKMLLRRVLHTVPLLIGVSFFVFALIEVAPGDVAERAAGPDATREQVAEVRHELGLDRSFLHRYGSYVGDAVHGDLGTSMYTHERVRDMVSDRLPITLGLTVLALVMGVALGVVLGLVSSVRPNGILDRFVAVLTSVAVASPPFAVALLLVVFLAVHRSVFPATGFVPFGDGTWEWFRHLLLPSVALALLPAAEIARQLRGSMIESLDREYVLAARAKGVPPAVVRMKHALKNAAIPPVTVLGFRVAQLLGGTVVVERIFVLPGLGQLTVDSVLNRDYTALLGAVLLSAVLVSVISLLVDASYLYFNPKLRST